MRYRSYPFGYLFVPPRPGPPPLSLTRDHPDSPLQDLVLSPRRVWCNTYWCYDDLTCKILPSLSFIHKTVLIFFLVGFRVVDRYPTYFGRPARPRNVRRSTFPRPRRKDPQCDTPPLSPKRVGTPRPPPGRPDGVGPSYPILVPSPQAGEGPGRGVGGGRRPGTHSPGERPEVYGQSFCHTPVSPVEVPRERRTGSRTLVYRRRLSTLTTLTVVSDRVLAGGPVSSVAGGVRSGSLGYKGYDPI